MIEEQPPAVIEPGHWLDLRRRFAAPWQFVFKQWIEPHELAAWFGPIGYRVAAYLVEPEVGGGWRMTLRSPAGEDFVVGGRFLEIEPPGRLRFTWRPDGEPSQARETEVLLTLAAAHGTTRLRLRHGPFATAEQAESHAKAWASTLDSLALKLDEESR